MEKLREKTAAKKAPKVEAAEMEARVAAFVSR
jgi:hypothetical protein